MKEEKMYTIDQIATLLGVNISSIERWVDSGKLKCFGSECSDKKFSTEQLKEFAMTHNIAMKFLLETVQGENTTNEIVYKQISAAQ